MDKSWIDGNKTTVLIDNSAMRSVSYDFSHPSFKTLKKAVEEGDAQVIYTQISRGEFIEHCKEVIEDGIDKIKKLGPIRSFNEDVVDSLFKSSKEITAENVWDKFINEFQAKDISSDIDWRNVFDDYFNRKPPFSVKKKKEFGDGFTVKMIEKFNPDRLVIVSSDGDFENWAKERKATVVYKNMNEFADGYLRAKDERFSQISLQVFDKIKSSIVEKLKIDYSDDYRYNLIADDSEIEYANVVELKIVEEELSATSEEDQFAVFTIRLHGKTDLDLNCPVKIYDSVDKEDIYWGSNKRTATVDIEIISTITLFVDTEDFDIDEESFFAEDFEVPHDWTSFLDSDDEEFQ